MELKIAELDLLEQLATVAREGRAFKEVVLDEGSIETGPICRQWKVVALGRVHICFAPNGMLYAEWPGHYDPEYGDVPCIHSLKRDSDVAWIMQRRFPDDYIYHAGN